MPKLFLRRPSPIPKVIRNGFFLVLLDKMVKDRQPKKKIIWKYVTAIAYKIATPKLIFCFGVVTFSLMSLLYVKGSCLTPGPLSLQFASSREEFVKIVESWGYGGVGLYKNSLLIDYIYPWAYAGFLSGIIALQIIGYSGKPSVFQLLIFLFPWLAALLDWVENTTHWFLLLNIQQISNRGVFFSVTVSLLKWFLVLASVSYIIIYNTWRIVAKGMKK